MRRKLALVLAAMTVAAAAGVLYGPAAVQIPAGLLLAFALPGAGLTAVLFRTRSALSGYERFTFIPALSLATLVLGGMLAWTFGLPLDRGTWLGVSGVVALLGLLAAAAWPAAEDPAHTAATAAVPIGAPAVADRGVRLPTNTDHALVLPVDLDRQGVFTEDKSWFNRPAGRRVTREIVPLVLVAALLGGAAWLSFANSRDVNDVDVVSLAASPPGPLTEAGEREVEVTAAGLPSRDTSYAVVVTGETGNEIERFQVTADVDGVWQTELSLPGEERITIGLYRPGDTTAFRTVIIANAN